MNDRVILLRYSEIHLKGKNRGYFENMLLANIRKFLPRFHATLNKSNARYTVTGYDAVQEDELIAHLTKIFGLHSLSPAYVVENDLEQIATVMCAIAKSRGGFRVNVNRADKTFPITSVEAAAELGGRLLTANPKLVVDLHKPDFVLSADIREDGKTFVFVDTYACVGGMPVGTAGHGLLLLSGGIDSPVAGYMMAKRGLKLKALHFFSPPYTSEAARQKVEDLATCIAPFTGDVEIFFVPFARVQEEIHSKCDESFMITIMRRIMMRVANKLCYTHHLGTIITGESLGQVASQTLQSMTVTNMIAEVPVLRPLVGFDKQEIIEISKRIETYDISIRPYDDCCTVFLPPNPQIHPKLEKVLREESHLDIDELVTDALARMEIIRIG